MRKPNTEFAGDLQAAGATLLWALYPILVAASSGQIRPLLFAGSSILLSGLLLISFLMVFSRQSLRLSRQAIVPAALGTLLIVVIAFALAFIAGQNTSPANLAIISQAEVFFSFLFFGLLGYERISRKRVFGAILVFFGIFVLFSGQLEAGALIWQSLILLAAMIAPLGNHFQKKAMEHVSPLTLLAFRNLFGGLILFCGALLIEKPHLAETFSREVIILILLNGILAFGLSKWLVLSAFRNIGVAKSIAINALMPAFTVVFSTALLQTAPTLPQLIGLLLVTSGVPLIVSRIPQTFSGAIANGDGIGKTLGFPTLNLDTGRFKPQTGVYAIRLTIDDRGFYGVMHAGPRPTFGKLEFRTEVHLFDFEDTVETGRFAQVTILKKIRDVGRFGDREALRSQIGQDVEQARRFLETI